MTGGYMSSFYGPELGTVAPSAQWRTLADVGLALSRCAEPAATLAEVTDLVVPQAADFCVLYLAGDDEEPATLVVTHVERTRVDDIRDRMGGLSSGAGAESLLRGLDAAEEDWTPGSGTASALLAELGLSGGMVAPIRLSGQPRGLLALGVETAEIEGADNVTFGRVLADRIGLELERFRARRRSERAVAASELAVGIVSHDLGNPLATIQICANALLDPEPQPAAGVREIAEIIRRSAAWMQQIIRDLLDRVSLDTGRLPLIREPVAVSDVMGAAQAMFRPLAGEEGLEFAIEYAGDLPRVDADPHRLQEVLSNLLGNAMKFTPAGGRVVLSARATSDQENRPAVRFAVSDTGQGIPEQDLPHVFDWFWHSQTGKRASTGLGLAIAKGVIEAHRAHLMVESVPGYGSTFWFNLPVCGSTEEDGPCEWEARR
jgi:signal transduction histidine kinase